MGNGDIQGICLVFVLDGDDDIGVDWVVYFFNSFVECQFLNLFVIDIGDQVICQNVGFCCWGVVDWGNDFY